MHEADSRRSRSDEEIGPKIRASFPARTGPPGAMRVSTQFSQAFAADHPPFASTVASGTQGRHLCAACFSFAALLAID